MNVCSRRTLVLKEVTSTQQQQNRHTPHIIQPGPCTCTTKRAVTRPCATHTIPHTSTPSNHSSSIDTQALPPLTSTAPSATHRLTSIYGRHSALLHSAFIFTTLLLRRTLALSRPRHIQSSLVMPAEGGPMAEPVSPNTAYSIEQTVDEIMSYLKKAGTEAYLGPQEESVTQLSHSLQAAHQAAAFVQTVKSSSTIPPPLFTSPSIPTPSLAPATEALLYGEDIILAALLHDVGHMILSKPDSWDSLHDVSEQHEWVGYHYLLRHRFSPQIADLVLGHVQAKRYLCYREPGYHARLSDSSRMTLIGQGGPMSEEEAAQFERAELFDVKLRMRVWDEEAKIVDWKERGDEMERYRDMMVRHLTQQTNKQQQQQQRSAA